MEQRSTSKSTDKRGRAAAAGGRGRTSAVGTAAGGISDDPVVGVLGAPHGVRGEVKVHPRTDIADRFREGSREELMFPASASVVREVDIAGGRVVVVPQEILG